MNTFSKGTKVDFHIKGESGGQGIVTDTSVVFARAENRDLDGRCLAGNRCAEHGLAYMIDTGQKNDYAEYRNIDGDLWVNDFEVSKVSS